MSVLSNRVVFNDEWDDIQKDPLFEKEISLREWMQEYIV